MTRGQAGRVAVQVRTRFFVVVVEACAVRSRVEDVVSVRGRNRQVWSSEHGSRRELGGLGSNGFDGGVPERAIMFVLQLPASSDIVYFGYKTNGGHGRQTGLFIMPLYPVRRKLSGSSFHLYRECEGKYRMRTPKYILPLCQYKVHGPLFSRVR